MNATAQNPTFYKRKKVYINKDFQTRFIVKFILVLILGATISIGLTLYNTQGTLTSTFSNSKLVIQNTSLAIMPSVIYTTLITTCVLSIIVIMVTLLVSHKIAGPMYRFEKDIKRVTNGDLKTRIHIRRGDQFLELATVLNGMIKNLNQEVSAIKHDVDTLACHTDLQEEFQKDVVRLKEKINSSFLL
ncbi:MAG: methyl-accepting chemotaxis protein [Desulfobacteraceae bacterium]|nr:methyl-accepting chemotaxis protein [Desulfobacteraceae bacterium]